MQVFLQQVVDGLTWGALYAAFALSIVLVYRASGIVNFAQGEMAMISAFCAWQFHQWGAPLYLAIAGAMVVAFLFGALTERVLIRPLASSPNHMPLVIITLGLMLVLNSAAGFAAHDASLPQLIQRFEEQFRNEQGLPNEAVDTRRWPALHFRLEGSDGGEVCLRCEPAQYWQRNANAAGQSLFLLLRWSRQSVLGLPLLCGRYCIFDRRDDECGRVRLADLR